MKVKIANPIYDVVLDQSNRKSDNHILNVREDNFPEKYRPLIRRLQMAAVDSEVKHRMEQEDIHLRYVQNVERAAHHKGLAEGLEKGRAEGEEERSRLQAEKEAAQAEKEAAQAQLKQKDTDIVLKIHQSGESVENISKFTSLSIEEIQRILDNHS